MVDFKHITIPDGEEIEIDRNEGKIVVPDNPIIPYIRGDGIGPEVTTAARRVIDAAVAKIYGGTRSIRWMEVYAGEVARKIYGEGISDEDLKEMSMEKIKAIYLPHETLEAIKHFVVAIKGPLTTPVAGGFRSLNVGLRQALDLYANVRPIFYIKGVPSPVKHPERMNMVLFRENTEDVYAGIEWPRGSEEARKVIQFLEKEFGVKLREDSGIGIKPISEHGTKRLVRKAIQYALEKGRSSVTLVHKGNIMKYTEGAFRDWGYELAREEFGDVTITETELWHEYDGSIPEGKIVIKDRIADNMLQQLLTRSSEYDVLALPNLNGDYLSDAAAAQVGGLGVAPGGNIGDYIAVFEPVHGTAPKYAGMNKVNPTAEILSGCMMLEYLGWDEASTAIKNAIEKTIYQRIVTYDLARQIGGVDPVGTSEYASAIIENL